MSFYEIFDECNLNVLKEEQYFRRKMRPNDNEFAGEAYKLSIDLWLKRGIFLVNSKITYSACIRWRNDIQL